MDKKKEICQRLKSTLYWEIRLLQEDMKSISSCEEKKLFYHGMLSAYNMILSVVNTIEKE